MVLKKRKDNFLNIDINDKSYVIKEGEVELSLSSRYICVYICDRNGNYSYVFGSATIFNNYFKNDMKVNDVHTQARILAFSGKKVSYDWFDNSKFPNFFNTVIIPLSNQEGKVISLLFIIKNIEELSVRQNNTLIVSEKAGESFIQVILRAREEEKRTITSAIHDQLGNFSIRSNALLEVLETYINSKSTKKALQTLHDLQNIVRDTVSSMKDTITFIRPPQLDSVGLNSAIKDLLDKVKKAIPLNIRYEYKIKDKTILSKNAKTILYRVVQESLSNTVKYAEASNFSVELEEKGSNICLTVKDDGKGFKTQAHRSAKSLGLAGMSENVASLKGTMKLQSELGKGTTITVICPKFKYR